MLILSGGNIDPMILNRVIEKGLVADGRLCRFTAVVSDRPGGLARLAQLIAQTGASVKDIAHDRAFSGPDVPRPSTCSARSKRPTATTSTGSIKCSATTASSSCRRPRRAAGRDADHDGAASRPAKSAPDFARMVTRIRSSGDRAGLS